MPRSLRRAAEPSSGRRAGHRESASCRSAATPCPSAGKPSTRQLTFVTIATDGELVDGIRAHLRERARAGFTAAFVESAGGVHSPTLAGSSQLQAYRPLRLPTVLVASHALGGISATLSAYESLLLRGYDVDAVLCFDEERYDNAAYFGRWFAERGIAFASIASPPPRQSQRDAETSSMRGYYDRAVGPLSPIVAELQRLHSRRLADLDTAGQRALNGFWWPFVQHELVRRPDEVMLIDSAHGDAFAVAKPNRAPDEDLIEPTFDGSASWWTQAFGHAHHEIALAVAHAAGRYGHVMFPTASHPPALRLTERLLETVGSGWASRVFFSDDGSTAMEIALKMALRVRADTLGEDVDLTALGIVGLSGGYHGAPL